MGYFEESWLAVAKPRNREKVSPQLRPLLKVVYTALHSQPIDLSKLTKGLRNLLHFLATEGRTNANCWAVDRFFGLSQGWERDWADQALPDDIHDVLAKIGEALHDTVQAPEIAENFGCLPEQHLEEVTRCSANHGISDN